MSDAPTWFADEAEPTPRRRRRRLATVLVLAAGAWVLVALALVRSTPDAEAPPPALDTTAAAHAPDTAADPPAWPEPGPGPTAPTTADAPPDVETADGAEATGPPATPTPVSRREAEAIALAVVRGWLSDDGPDLGIPDISSAQRGYLEHAIVESVDVPSPDLAVARVLTVLLLRDEERYTEAVLRRVAVPLTLTADDVRPAGPPWWLPTAPDLTTAPPPTAPVDDPAAVDAVTAALEDAGYRVAVIADLRESEGGALVARVTAATPAGEQVDGPVWFGRSLDGLTVLGWPGAAVSGLTAPHPGDAPAAADD